jgi:hypothetical protein
LQCYGYGFAKIEDKNDMYFGAYVHPDFQRDHPTRACNIPRRSTLRGDRRFKKNNATVRNHQIQRCGTHAQLDRTVSFSSLETWHSTGDMTPEVKLDSEWNDVGSSTISVETSDSLLPCHVSPDDGWLSDLQMAFASSMLHNAASSSNGILSFAEFRTLCEPRPIELMFKN